MATPVSMAIDLNHQPVVMLKADGRNFLNSWDKAANQWIAHPPVADGGKVFVDPQGVITVLGQGWHPSEQPVTHPLPHRIHLIDREHFRRTGDIRGLTGRGERLMLVQVHIGRPVTYAPFRTKLSSSDDLLEVACQLQFKTEAPVVCELSIEGDPSISLTSPASLTFDLSNWNQNQTVSMKRGNSGKGTDATLVLRSKRGNMRIPLQ